jgi:ribonuclease E
MATGGSGSADKRRRRRRGGGGGEATSGGRDSVGGGAANKGSEVGGSASACSRAATETAETAKQARAQRHRDSLGNGAWRWRRQGDGASGRAGAVAETVAWQWRPAAERRLDDVGRSGSGNAIARRRPRRMRRWAAACGKGRGNAWRVTDTAKVWHFHAGAPLGVGGASPGREGKSGVTPARESCT